MKKWFRHIIAILLAFMFLVSFTGIRMLIHHCLSCDTTEYAFALQAEDCCGGIHHHHEAACCEVADDMEGACDMQESNHCCETEIQYLKNEYQVAQERLLPKVLPVEMAALPLDFSNLQPEPSVLKSTGNITFIPPPPKLTGRDFVLFTHQLKYC